MDTKRRVLFCLVTFLPFEYLHFEKHQKGKSDYPSMPNLQKVYTDELQEQQKKQVSMKWHPTVIDQI